MASVLVEEFNSEVKKQKKITRDKKCLYQKKILCYTKDN